MQDNILLPPDNTPSWKNYMEWIKCSDRMPPSIEEDDNEVILYYSYLERKDNIWMME